MNLPIQQSNKLETHEILISKPLYHSNIKILSSYFSRDTAAAQDGKRVKKKKKEQRRNDVKLQKFMGRKQAYNSQIHGEDLANAETTRQKLGHIKLPPRSYIKTLEHLI